MSKCISINGEYSEHEPNNQEFVCGRCFAFDEDAVMAEVGSLREQLAERDALVESQARQIENLSEGTKNVLRGWDKTLDQLAEREAVIEQVRDGLRHLADAQQSWIDAGRVEQAISREAIRDRAEEMLAALDASPSTVLAEHDHAVLVAYEETRKPDPIHIDNIDGLHAATWLAEHEAQVLEEAAEQIPEQMRRDELDMHMLSRVDQLPQLSQVMLNGATRFAERLTKRAAEYRKWAGQ